MKKKIKIAIKGAYGERNFGDDALQYFLHKWSLNSKIPVTFFGNKNNYITKLLPNISYLEKKNIHRYRINKLILGGGTQFFSFKTNQKPPNRLELLISNPLIFLKKSLLYLEKKLLFNNPFYKETHSFGIGFGPFDINNKIKRQAVNDISLMKSVFPRDTYSFNFAKKININTKKGTDICFLPKIIDYSKFYNNRRTIKKIGFIVRDWNYNNGGEEYLDKIIKNLDDLNEFEVDFIFFKDEKVCESKLKKFNIIKWNPEKQSIENFLHVLSSYDLFISARFHGVIFGGLLNIPSIAIEIEPKLKLTKELLGMGVIIWKQPFNENLKQIINNISLEEMKKELKKNILIQSNLARNMFNELTIILHE